MQHFVDFVSSEMLLSFWLSAGMELSLFALTCLGFFVFRSEKAQSLVACIWRIGGHGKKEAYLPAKELEANFLSGHFQSVLDTWASLKHLSVGGLSAVVQSLVAMQRHPEIPEVVQRALKGHRDLRNADSMNAVLDGVSSAKLPLECLVAMCKAFAEAGVHANDVTVERLLPTLCQLSPTRALHFLSQVSDRKQWSVNTYAQLARMALKAKNLNDAIEYLHAMHDAGHIIPHSCLTLLLTRSADKSLSELNAVFRKLPSIQLPQETLAALLEQAAKTSDRTSY